MKTFAKIIVLVLVAGVAWTAWAAASFYDLAAGLQADDAVTQERRIDWTGVRQALREDLQTSPTVTTADHPAGALASERAIRALLLSGKLEDRGRDNALRSASEFDWQRVRYAFFASSPLYFRVDLKPARDNPGQPLVLLFRWTGDWRLVRIFLPAAEAKPALASQDRPAPSAAPVPPVVPALALPTGAQRVTLYEEVPNDPQGKRHDGWVIWRSGQTPPATGGPPGFAVTAAATVPGRPLDLTMRIRRNTDAALPASHTIEINFTLPPGSDIGGITDLVAVMMKPDEESPGQHLAASRVKVRDGFFMIGLSGLDVDVRHNMDLLKARPWIGLPLRYGNGSRAVLVIEKGETGDRVLADAFARWDSAATAATGASAHNK